MIRFLSIRLFLPSRLGDPLNGNPVTITYIEHILNRLSSYFETVTTGPTTQFTTRTREWGSYAGITERMLEVNMEGVINDDDQIIDLTTYFQSLEVEIEGFTGEISEFIL